MIFRNLILRRLDDMDLAALGGAMREVSLDAGEQIFDVDEPVHHLYLPGTAVLSVLTVMESGQCVETSTIGAENAPGLLSIIAESISTSRVFTQVAGSAMQIPAGAVRAYAHKNPAFLIMLLKFALASSAYSELSVACNALHGVNARLARWLLMTQDRVGSATVPLTQEFLSLMLGVQRTTVTAAAASLKHRGIIEYRRGRIVVLDRPGLEAASCECYALGRTISKRLVDEAGP